MSLPTRTLLSAVLSLATSSCALALEPEGRAPSNPGDAAIAPEASRPNDAAGPSDPLADAAGEPPDETACYPHMARACAVDPSLVLERDTAGNALRWHVSPDCVPTSIDPALASHADELRAALATWASVACSRLCFAPPTIETYQADAFDCVRRIHFEPRDRFMNGSTVGLYMTPGTGELGDAEVSVEAVLGDAAALSRLVGEALGLSRELPIVGSDGQPNDDARAAMCVAYGDARVCL